MGKRRDWPSPEKVAELQSSIRTREPEILSTHHLIGTEKEAFVVVVQDGRLFDLLGDDDYLRTLEGALKTAGKPIHPDIDALMAALEMDRLDG